MAEVQIMKLCKNLIFVVPAKETVQETNICHS